MFQFSQNPKDSGTDGIFHNYMDWLPVKGDNLIVIHVKIVKCFVLESYFLMNY